MKVHLVQRIERAPGDVLLRVVREIPDDVLVGPPDLDENGEAVNSGITRVAYGTIYIHARDEHTARALAARLRIAPASDEKGARP